MKLLILKVNISEINTIKELDIYNDFDSLAALLKNLDMFITEQ